MTLVTCQTEIDNWPFIFFTPWSEKNYAKKFRLLSMINIVHDFFNCHDLSEDII